MIHNIFEILFFESLRCIFKFNWVWKSSFFAHIVLKAQWGDIFAKAHHVHHDSRMVELVLWGANLRFSTEAALRELCDPIFVYFYKAFYKLFSSLFDPIINSFIKLCYFSFPSTVIDTECGSEKYNEFIQCLTNTNWYLNGNCFYRAHRYTNQVSDGSSWIISVYFHKFEGSTFWY